MARDGIDARTSVDRRNLLFVAALLCPDPDQLRFHPRVITFGLLPVKVSELRAPPRPPESNGYVEDECFNLLIYLRML